MTDFERLIAALGWVFALVYQYLFLRERYRAPRQTEVESA